MEKKRNSRKEIFTVRKSGTSNFLQSGSQWAKHLVESSLSGAGALLDSSSSWRLITAGRSGLWSVLWAEEAFNMFFSAKRIHQNNGERKDYKKTTRPHFGMVPLFEKFAQKLPQWSIALLQASLYWDCNVI